VHPKGFARIGPHFGDVAHEPHGLRSTRQRLLHCLAHKRDKPIEQPGRQLLILLQLQRSQYLLLGALFLLAVQESYDQRFERLALDEALATKQPHCPSALFRLRALLSLVHQDRELPLNRAEHI
jgi:hypothetical protein